MSQQTRIIVASLGTADAVLAKKSRTGPRGGVVTRKELARTSDIQGHRPDETGSTIRVFNHHRAGPRDRMPTFWLVIGLPEIRLCGGFESSGSGSAG